METSLFVAVLVLVVMVVVQVVDHQIRIQGNTYQDKA